MDPLFSSVIPLISDAGSGAFGANTVTVLAEATEDAPDTEGLADFLRGFFGPLFLVIVSIVAIFFLFTREITRFAQFIILAIFIGIVFYVPGIIEVTAEAIAGAMGVSTED